MSMVNTESFNQDELKTAFEKLTEGMENWKMPIHTAIHISELNLMIEACEFFTGSNLYRVKDLGLGMFEVKADGYYMAVGS